MQHFCAGGFSCQDLLRCWRLLFRLPRGGTNSWWQVSWEINSLALMGTHKIGGKCFASLVSK